MVDIISKRDGPRREDVPIKRLLDQNRSTIMKLADQISGGGYSANKARDKARREGPKPQGLIIHVGGAAAAAEPRPVIRVSLNGRVIAVDENNGRQMHHIGDIRRRQDGEAFVLATKANGYFKPVDDTVAAALAGLDGARIDETLDEERLAAAVAAALGIA